MTPEEFQRDGGLRAKLAEILTDPVLKQAIQVVKDATEPAAGNNDRDPVKKAALYDQRAGANALIANLKTLCKAPSERKTLTGRSLAKSPDDLPPDQ